MSVAIVDEKALGELNKLNKSSKGYSLTLYGGVYDDEETRIADFTILGLLQYDASGDIVFTKVTVVDEPTTYNNVFGLVKDQNTQEYDCDLYCYDDVATFKLSEITIPTPEDNCLDGSLTITILELMSNTSIEVYAYAAEQGEIVANN